jgi:hypothetical protein
LSSSRLASCHHLYVLTMGHLSFANGLYVFVMNFAGRPRRATKWPLAARKQRCWGATELNQALTNPLFIDFVACSNTIHIQGLSVLAHNFNILHVPRGSII